MVLCVPESHPELRHNELSHAKLTWTALIAEWVDTHGWAAAPNEAPVCRPVALLVVWLSVSLRNA